MRKFIPVNGQLPMSDDRFLEPEPPAVGRVHPASQGTAATASLCPDAPASLSGTGVPSDS